jgi:predicted nucleic acid-binding protein
VKVFFDTSALVKYFHEEEGTDIVTSLIENTDHDVWISELALIEFVSAMYKKYRARELSKQDVELALEGFTETCAGISVEPLGQVVSQEAIILLNKYGSTHFLRTLDALQLAAFKLIAESNSIFVSADINLCAVAASAGYSAINPAANH